tara:strand:+ start:697 stop:1158 length:462 start_codon:yes stop_codon:yes gene_type:complete
VDQFIIITGVNKMAIRKSGSKLKNIVTKGLKEKIKKEKRKRKEKDIPDSFKGMSQKDIDEMLGKPTTDSEGVLRQRKKGGQIKTASSSWMDGLSQSQIDEILGKPPTDSSGVKRSQKKPVKAKKTRVAKSGGAIGCGKALRGQGKGPYKKKGM